MADGGRGWELEGHFQTESLAARFLPSVLTFQFLPSSNYEPVDCTGHWAQQLGSHDPNTRPKSVSCYCMVLWGDIFRFDSSHNMIKVLNPDNSFDLHNNNFKNSIIMLISGVEAKLGDKSR